MKYVLHPSRANTTTRHCYSLFVGLIFGLMCFGLAYVSVYVEVTSFVILSCREMLYLLIVVGSCYGLLLVISPKVVQK